MKRYKQRFVEKKGKFSKNDKVKDEIGRSGKIMSSEWITDTKKLSGDFDVKEIEKMLPTYLYWIDEGNGEEFWALEPQLGKK